MYTKISPSKKEVSLSTLLRYLIVAFIISQVLKKLKWKYKAGLRNLPGPWLASFFEVWRMTLTSGGNAPLEYQKLHEKYGKIVRTGPDSISIGDPDMIPAIYGFNNTYIKSSFYDAFTTFSPKTGLPEYNVFSTQEPAQHKLLRSRVANKYSLTALKDLEPLVDECSEIFLTKMRHIASKDPKASVDLGEWLQFYAFDVIGAITFRQHFGFMEKGEDVDDMIGGLEIGLKYTGTVANIKGLHSCLFGSPTVTAIVNMIPALARGNPIPKFTKIAKEAIIKYDTDDVNQQHRSDFLSWFRKEAARSKDRITDDELVSYLLVNLLAGSDTTAISLRAILYYLIKTPRAYQKLQREIDEMDSAGALSSKVTLDESNRMTYLQAAMKEAMRLHAGVGYPLERLVPSGGANLCGFDIPGGTRVGINAWVVHMDKEVFGNDAALYRPERWLEASADQLKVMDKSFIAFGAGTRTCIGKNISLLEMGKLVPEIFRNFDLEWAAKDEEWKVSTFWFAKQSGIQIRCIPRQKKSKG